MKATTIKLGGKLLQDLEAAKPTGRSLSSYVKEILARFLDRLQAREAAEKYVKVLRRDSAERRRLANWEKSDLTSLPKKKVK